MNDDLPFDLALLHTTDMGVDRIRRNLGLSSDTDPAAFCRSLIEAEGCAVSRQGKNYYCEKDGVRVTVNAGSLTIITAHRVKPDRKG